MFGMFNCLWYPSILKLGFQISILNSRNLIKTPKILQSISGPQILVEEGMGDYLIIKESKNNLPILIFTKLIFHSVPNGWFSYLGRGGPYAIHGYQISFQTGGY